MRAYLAIKFYEDHRNRQHIDALVDTFSRTGIELVCMQKHVERYGDVSLTPAELMRRAFDEIEKSDFITVDTTEKGMGIGIEAGYAYKAEKPVVIIAKPREEVSTTLRGIAADILEYSSYDELSTRLKEWKTRTAHR